MLRVTEQAVRKVCVKEQIPKSGRQWVLTPEQLRVLVRHLRLRRGRPSKSEQRNYKEEVARILKFSSQPRPAQITEQPVDDLNAKAQRVANNLENIAIKVDRFWTQRDRINPKTLKAIRNTAVSLAKFITDREAADQSSGSGLKPSRGMRP